ncbi:cytochrome C oxidase subunit IV family protein [Psychromonas sp. MB-3u-54]|uniref:cytochrome C oxidase subunit IV family protein n=1 Tax=Psychromonas sp. MB-3u-54 TaxID=2058319 RepID=UPI001E492D5D|nr:cytochrome C oxidase subunit IV family protein [Psychromonas sp. MB-3u-54]
MMTMFSFSKLEYLWLTLLAIILFNTLLGENVESTALVSILVALTVMYKGLIVIDHFMELKDANKYLRRMMRIYFIFFPSLIILSAFF